MKSQYKQRVPISSAYFKHMLLEPFRLSGAVTVKLPFKWVLSRNPSLCFRGIFWILV